MFVCIKPYISATIRARTAKVADNMFYYYSIPSVISMQHSAFHGKHNNYEHANDLPKFGCIRIINNEVI